MSQNTPITVHFVMDFPNKTNHKMGILTVGRIYSSSPVAPQADGKASMNGYSLTQILHRKLRDLSQS